MPNISNSGNTRSKKNLKEAKVLDSENQYYYDILQ